MATIRKQDEGVFMIAEAGVNHGGDLSVADQLIEAAARAGADAVKFQTFSADRLVTPDARKASYQKETTGEGSQHAMLKRLELSADDHRHLLETCAAHDIEFMSTPFDEESADLLETLGVSAYKVSSGDLTNLPFLRYLADKGRPLIVSTGMANIGEVEDAVSAVEGADLTLLHCVSNYPTEPAHVNLKAMETLRCFGHPVGYSDHTLGIEFPIAAVALGATVIEKHFTLNRSLPGPDHRASLEPGELAEMVRAIRNIEAGLGDGRKRPAPGEDETAAVARKSLVAARDIASGEVLTEELVTARRPGTGLSPKFLSMVVGRRAARDIAENELLRLADLS
jgi:N-acetylneuraminate synthase